MHSATASSSVSKVTSDRDQEHFREETSVLLTWSIPTWKKELQDLIVEERDRGVQLVCICKDLAHPSAKWFHKGREVFSDFHMKVRQAEETASLTIKEIREQDSGTFKCVMTGGNGQLETSCVLTVKASEVILPPVFVKELQDVKVEEGEQLQLAVEVRGTPPVGVFWLHNNLEITRDNPHFLMASLGHVHTLSLLRATTKYSGEYVCEAYNDFGDTDTFCFVEVREAEHPNPPGFVSRPSPVTAKEGETITFRCQVKGQPAPTVLWEREGVVIATSQKYKITKLQEQHTLTIYDVNQADAGEYVCQLHGSGSQLSHMCSLSITSDSHLIQPQHTNTVKTKLVYIRDLHETEEKSTLQQDIPGPQEMSRLFQHNNSRSTGNKSEHAEGSTEIETSRASYETIVGAQSTIYAHSSALPQTPADDYECDDHNTDHHVNRRQFQDQHGDDVHDSINSTKFNVSLPPTTKNVHPEESAKQQNVPPETKPNYHSVLSKAERKVEEKKVAVNTGATDFRSILKHRVTSPSHHIAKPVEQNVDLQKPSFCVQQIKEKTTVTNESSKEDILVYKLINIPVGQTTNTSLSQNAELTSLSHSKSTALSSQEVQPLRNKSSKGSSASARHRELTSFPKTSATFNYLDSSSEANVESSLMTRHAAGTSENPASSEYVGKVMSEQKLYVSVATGESDKECVQMDVYKQQHIVIRDDNLTVRERNNAETAGMSAACFMDDKLLDNNKGEEKVYSPSREKLYISEIQIMNTRTDGRRDYVTSISPHAEQNFKVSLNATPSPANRNHTRSRGSFSDVSSVEPEAQQESSPPYKVSIVHINPEVPRSSSRPDEFKLEVTSVSMSIPLRSSTSSPRSHSSSNSVSVPVCFPGQTSTDFTDGRHEDTDDVFAVSEERRPAQAEQSTSSSEHKATLQSYGPAFTWEKAPWDMQKAVQDNSTFDSMNVNTMKEWKSKDPSLLENSEVNDNNRQWERSLISTHSVNSKIRSASDCDILPSFEKSQRSVHAAKNANNDFRTMKLKPAAGKVKSDLIRSKFMSVSTECVFADVKLKSVSKMNDRWRKSQVSLNTERFQNVPKSRDSVSRSSEEPSQQTFKTPGKTMKTTVKLSENLRTVNNAKSQNENMKPANKSKIKTVAEKYEKSPPVSVPRTKSKGVGAKFEASIKDSQVNSRNTFGNLPNSAKKNLSEINTSKSAASSNLKSGKVLEKIQHWKVAEITSSVSSDKKMLGSLGKSNSHSNVLERGKDTDKIMDSSAKHKKHSLQSNEIPNFVAKSELAAPIKGVSKASQIFERAEVNVDKEVLNETSYTDTEQVFDLNQTGTQTLKSDSLSGNNVQHAGLSNVKTSILGEQNVKQTTSRKVIADTSENKHINVNKIELLSMSKIESPKAARSQQDVKSESTIRKPLKNVETKVRASISENDQQTKTKSEWVNARSSKQYQQTEIQKGNKHTAEFKLSTGLRNTRKDEQNSFVHVTSKKSGRDIVESQTTSIASLDSKQNDASSELNGEDNAVVFGKSAMSKAAINSAGTDIPVLVTPDNVEMVQTATLITNITPTFGFFDSPSTASNVLASSEMASSTVVDEASFSAGSGHIDNPADTPYPIPIGKDTELPTTFRRSSITRVPQEEIRSSETSVDPHPNHTSTIARKDSPVDYSKHVHTYNDPSSEDHLSHIRNFQSSWVKQKHQKSVPAHQSQDMGLVLYQEQLRSSMDDSESVLSTTSISSSSSDASTVTVDSGYPRYSSRKHVDNDRIELQSKNPCPEQSKASVAVTHPGKLDKEVKNTRRSFQRKKNFFENVDNKNVGDQFKLGDSDRNIHILASNLKHTTGAREKATIGGTERISGLGPCDGPQLTSDSIGTGGSEQVTSRRRQFVNEVTTVQETLKEDCKNTNQLTDVKHTDQQTDVKDTEDVADLTNDFGTTRKYSKKRRKQQQTDVNGILIVTSPEFENPTSKSIEEFKAHETNTETITVQSNLTFKPEESTDKYKTKETRTNLDSEGANQKSNLSRRWRVRENINEDMDNKQKTKSHDKSSANRPTDLDLTANWRRRKPKVKPDPEDKEIKIASQSQEDIKKSTATSLGSGTGTSYNVRPSAEPQQQQYPPSFPVPLRDTKVILGSTAVLYCQVIGDPQPEVKWLLNHNQLEPSANIEILYSQDKAQLTVKETFTEHVGDYSCWAKNLLGTVSTHCTLNLETSNKTESRAFEGPVFAPPKIVLFAPSALTLARGACLNLAVTFLGEPGPTVRWMRGDAELISDNHVQILTEANSSCLTIESVTRSDAGKMSVCLTSSTGADQASTNIYIEDVPGCPVGRPHVYDIDRNSASLSWCGPAYSEGCQVTHYIIETRTRQDQAWDVIVPHCKDQSCHILDLKPCTTYQFRVLAVNKYGLSTPSEPSEAVYTTDPNRSPSDYESEAYADVFSPSFEIQTPDDLPFEPREVKINTSEQFEDVYELHKEVGKGKFGIVYKCKHKKEESIWAAKIVKCREQDKKVIRREIEIMNKLRHPKLLLLWDAYESQRQMVLVTEYVSAGELFERVIGEDFVLTECDCIHFLRQICEGVNYMHSNNILHLDLKPENILCIAENSNRIKIIDFGLAQFYHPGQSTKVLFGTPEFIAPEVINYDEIGFQTDMWSIGVICYVLLSGLSPFLGDNDAETLASVTSGEYDFDDEAFDEISDDAKDFISALLVKKKEHRLLTDQCLSHVWLAQHESGSVRRRRLNTERLKRFMVRRKWLKTGNAVLAVSRLLKSTNLGCLSSLNNISGSSSDLSDTESSISSPKPAVQRNTDRDVHIMQSQSVSEKTVKNQPISKLWRNKSPEEFTNTVENIVNIGQLSDASLEELSNSDFTDQNDNQIHTPQFIASGNDDNHNINHPVPPACTDSINAMSSATTCSSSAVEMRNAITTETEQGSTANEQRLPTPPVFVKLMINSDACIGDVARFDVIVAGYPLPVVTWCFEGEEICSDSRHAVEMNETTRSFSLIIRSIVEEDEGEYTCKAVNSQGEAVCVAELSVLDM